MELVDDEVLIGRKSSGGFGILGKKLQGKCQSGLENDKIDGVEGYVEVEGRDEELFEKIRINLYVKEKCGDFVERIFCGLEGGKKKFFVLEK